MWDDCIAVAEAKVTMKRQLGRCSSVCLFTLLWRNQATRPEASFKFLRFNSPAERVTEGRVKWSSTVSSCRTVCV